MFLGCLAATGAHAENSEDVFFKKLSGGDALFSYTQRVLPVSFHLIESDLLSDSIPSS